MRILFATIGSLGDLHPCLGLAMEMKRRGHSVAIATTEAYRARVLQLGIGFYGLRPNWDPTDSALISQCEDLKSGPEVLFRQLILPHLEDTYRDLIAAAQDCDLMLAGELVFAAPLVAEKLQLQWASLILSPCSFLSAHDPSLLVNMPHLIHLRRAGWRLNRAVLELGTRLIKNWWTPVQRLRVSEGLIPACAPLTQDKFSPMLVLALFSSQFAKEQPDWPKQTVQTGFPFFDSLTKAPLEPELARFLSAGEPPIVFTLGSTAVAHPGNFYQASREVAHRLKKRAVLIGSSEPQDCSEQFLTLAYVPYSVVFPRAAVIVHQGGSGTTGQALRAGRPQLIVPFGWDQPDNALRVERLGAGLTIAKADYSTDTAVTVLIRLFREPQFASRAAKIAKIIQSEDGLQEAADMLETTFVCPDKSACGKLRGELVRVPGGVTAELCAKG